MCGVNNFVILKYIRNLISAAFPPFDSQSSIADIDFIEHSLFNQEMPLFSYLYNNQKETSKLFMVSGFGVNVYLIRGE